MTEKATDAAIGADALDVAMSRACLRSWDASEFTGGECDAVHPMYAAAFDAGYRAALASAAQPPAGFVMVPVEPPEAMAKAGAQYAECGLPANAVFCYRAMLAAAPASAEGVEHG